MPASHLSVRWFRLEGWSKGIRRKSAVKRRLTRGVQAVVKHYPNHSHPLADAEKDSYLVDPASSHMLVSKIKPCMSKYKLLIL